MVYIELLLLAVFGPGVLQSPLLVLRWSLRVLRGGGPSILHLDSFTVCRLCGLYLLFRHFTMEYEQENQRKKVPGTLVYSDIPTGSFSCRVISIIRCIPIVGYPCCLAIPLKE